eukprot:SAG25_NODE_135_length_14397_cov_89.177857_3_plen_49_part_00
MMACSSLAREGHAVPKYCTSTSRCLMLIDRPTSKSTQHTRQAERSSHQ